MAEYSAFKHYGSNVLGYGASGAGIGTAIAPGIGTAIGAGVGAVVGVVDAWLTTPNEENESALIEAMKRGEVSPAELGYLERALSARFGEMRRDLGGQLARRGIADSSIAGRLMAKSYDAERQSLADALVGRSFQRQQLGFDVAGRRDAYDAQVGAGITNTVGQIVDLYDARRKLDVERQKPLPDYLKGPRAITRRPASTITGTNGSQPKSLMPSATNPSPGVNYPFLKSTKQLTRPTLKMNPSAGRSGMGQMSRL